MVATVSVNIYSAVCRLSYILVTHFHVSKHIMEICTKVLIFIHEKSLGASSTT